MKKLINILVFFVATSNVSMTCAYDGTTHSKIDEKAAAENVSQLSSILKNQLGIDEGIQYLLNKNGEEKRIWQWIAYGGEAEDFGHPYIPWKWDPTSTRAYNHFHDPLKVWDEAHFDHWTNAFYL